MEVKAALKSQYHSSLAMLRQTIERCPDDVWVSGKHPRCFWRIAYHTLFFADLYLQPDESAFRPWEGDRDGCQNLEAVPWPPHNIPPEAKPYAKAELLEYWARVDGMVDSVVDGLDLDAPTCGFPWYQLPKLDHEFMSVRHVQQHVGQLSEILYAAGIELDWVG